MVRFARVVARIFPHPITQRGNARRFILGGDAEADADPDLLQQGLQRQGVDLMNLRTPSKVNTHLFLLAQDGAELRGDTGDMTPIPTVEPSFSRFP